jgi:hypothetical protein
MKPASPFGPIITRFRLQASGDAEARVKHQPIIVDPPIFLLSQHHRPNG